MPDHGALGTGLLVALTNTWMFAFPVPRCRIIYINRGLEVLILCQGLSYDKLDKRQLLWEQADFDFGV